MRPPQRQRSRMRLRPLLWPLAILFVVACGPPVTVRRVEPQDVYRRDAASILDSGEQTRFADIELHRTAVSADRP